MAAIAVIIILALFLFAFVKGAFMDLDSAVLENETATGEPQNGEPQADAPQRAETPETSAGPVGIARILKERKQAAAPAPSAQPESPLKEPVTEHRDRMFKSKEDIKKAIIFSEIFNKKYN